MLRCEGRRIHRKRVERIWQEEGLKLPKKQPRKRRLFLNDGHCVRRRSERRNHVWSYDFVEDSTLDGRKLRFLKRRSHVWSYDFVEDSTLDGRKLRFPNMIDEHTGERLANIPRRSRRGTDGMEAWAHIMLGRGCPASIRSDNGPEFIAKK